MTPNIALEIEQQQRIANDQAALEADNDRKADLYAEGEFDGVIGVKPNPERWGELAYRFGWLDGIARHYDAKFKTELEIF